MTDRLDIWLYGTKIAHLTRETTDRIQLRWTPEASSRWGHGTRVLSAMLPIEGKPVPALVRTYLDGLLPEGNARTNQAMSVGVAPDSTFDLIAALGRDTPGAAVFVPDGSPDPTSEGTYDPITLDEVAVRLKAADQHSPAQYDGLTGESSTLPGMVPKITVHREGSTWFACKGGAASTWILKRAFPAESDVGDVIDTEVACLALARSVGLTTVQAEIIDFGDHRAIAVSRYDRPAGDRIERLHQEDLAQASGLNTSDPNRKFQYGARMPSLAAAANVLRIDGGRVDALLRLATFSFVVGNTDMHAKNISFLRMPDGRVRLAPAYDVAMHLHHPRDNRRSALDVNGKFRLDDLAAIDLVEEGVSWGLPRARSARVVAEMVDALNEAVRTIDRASHPGVSDAAWDRVVGSIQGARRSLSSQT